MAARSSLSWRPCGTRRVRCRAFWPASVPPGASIVTINQSTPENGAALVAVTIRTDTMQMTPEELTEKLSRQRMVVGVHCGYNL